MASASSRRSRSATGSDGVGDAARRRLAALWSALWPVALGVAIGVGAAALGIPREQFMLVASIATIAAYLGMGVAIAWPPLMARWRPGVPPRSGPVNFRALTVSAEGLAYVPLTGERIDIPWHAITRVEFMRCTSPFPHPWGGVDVETDWRLVLDDGDVIDIPHEHLSHAPLLRGMRANLGAFDDVSLAAALAAGVGSWTIWTRSPGA